MAEFYQVFNGINEDFKDSPEVTIEKDEWETLTEEMKDLFYDAHGCPPGKGDYPFGCEDCHVYCCADCECGCHAHH